MDTQNLQGEPLLPSLSLCCLVTCSGVEGMPPWDPLIETGSCVESDHPGVPCWEGAKVSHRGGGGVQPGPRSPAHLLCQWPRREGCAASTSLLAKTPSWLNCPVLAAPSDWCLLPTRAQTWGRYVLICGGFVTRNANASIWWRR